MAVIVWYPQMAFFLSVCTPGISSSSCKDTLVLLDERLMFLKGPISKYSYIGVRALTYEFWENTIQCIIFFFLPLPPKLISFLKSKYIHPISTAAKVSTHSITNSIIKVSSN